VTDKRIAQAIKTPPPDTRARARAAVARALTEHRIRYIIDWDQIYLENERLLSLRDPFDTYEEEAAAFIDEGLSRAPRSAPWARKERS
jgi:proteasome accessory factor A